MSRVLKHIPSSRNRSGIAAGGPSRTGRRSLRHSYDRRPRKRSSLRGCPCVRGSAPPSHSRSFERRRVGRALRRSRGRLRGGVGPKLARLITPRIEAVVVLAGKHVEPWLGRDPSQQIVEFGRLARVLPAFPADNRLKGLRGDELRAAPTAHEHKLAVV